MCDAKLEPVFPEPSGAPHFKGAMYVSLSGSGYAEFFDGDSPGMEILCEVCGEKFLQDNPFLMRLVREMR